MPTSFPNGEKSFQLGTAEEAGCAGAGSQPRIALAFTHRRAPSPWETCRQRAEEAGSRHQAGCTRWPRPCPAPGDPSLTGLQRPGHGHLVGLRQKASFLGSPHLLPGHHGVAGGSPCHSVKWRKVGGTGGRQLKGSASALRGCRGQQGKMWAALGVSLPAPYSFPVPSSSCQTLQGRGHAGYILHRGVSQRAGHKGPHCDPLPGPGGAGHPLQGVGTQLASGPWVLSGCP